MRCELCSSGKRERKQRLCPPCLEAMSRLWKVVNAPELFIGHAATGRMPVRGKNAAIVAVSPRFVSL